MFVSTFTRDPYRLSFTLYLYVHLYVYLYLFFRTTDVYVLSLVRYLT